MYTLQKQQQQGINGLMKGLLILLTVFLIYISLTLGVEDIHWKEITDKESFSFLLLFYSRIPRTISILIAGFGISIAGLIFQQISRNKFVSPTTAGTVSGAQLGMALCIAFVPNRTTFLLMLFALVVALIVSSVFMGMLRRLKFKELIYVPLLGLMLGSVIQAISTLIAYRYGFLQTLQSWMYGSFSLVTSGRYEILYVIIPVLVVAFIYAKAFTIASVGESFATNVGLNYNKIVHLGIVITSVVSACVVIVVGTIPFLGLVVPNIVSLYAGDHIEKNILDVGLVGMITLLICDILSRMLIYPYEIPIALVVGVLGTGVFLLLLLVRGRYKNG